MQLNKEQVKALANKIWTELSIAYNAKYKKQKDDLTKSEGKKFDVFRKKALAYQKEVKKMNGELRKLYDSNIDFFKASENYSSVGTTSRFENFLNSVELTYISKRPVKDIKSVPQLQEILNDIVLETIECENLEQIINKIKSKYK